MDEFPRIASMLQIYAAPTLDGRRQSAGDDSIAAKPMLMDDNVKLRLPHDHRALTFRTTLIIFGDNVVEPRAETGDAARQRAVAELLAAKYGKPPLRGRCARLESDRSR